MRMGNEGQPVGLDLNSTMTINRSQLARSAVQGACWVFAWRVFIFLVIAQALFLITQYLAPQVEVFALVAGYAAELWLLVRIVLPTWILLRRHYWRVFDLSVPAEPKLAKAIVTAQWEYLRHDLTLPWRAIRG